MLSHRDIYRSLFDCERSRLELSNLSCIIANLFHYYLLWVEIYITTGEVRITHVKFIVNNINETNINDINIIINKNVCLIVIIFYLGL